jgi:tRNA-dihydrouridine synthase B
MVTSIPSLWNSTKTRRRLDHAGENAPIAVQIAGTEPLQMADAARFNIDHGAQIIDINMGCPAKKVCNAWAGSALMQDEPLALRIVEAVVAACAPRGVSVTLKMRTGWSPEHRNAARLARAAEGAGVAMLTVHGRTRDQGYRGRAEHDTVAEIKSRVGVPVVANGDIDTPQRARDVLRHTGADALMIGRAAQGRPWIFREIAYFLETGESLPPPPVAEAAGWLLGHLDEHHRFYGEVAGVRSARKHIGWAVHTLPGGAAFRHRMNRIDDAHEQRRAVSAYFEALADDHPTWPAGADAAGPAASNDDHLLQRA